MSVSLKSTTLSAAVSADATSITVASATYISSPTNNMKQGLYVIPLNGGRGEFMEVESFSGTQVQVARLCEFRMKFVSGSIVMIGYVDPTIISFHSFDPVGVPTTSGVNNQVTPYINAVNGNQWLVGKTGSWVPGWNNADPKGVTADVVSANAFLTPSGPLFHITGTTGPITGFNLPLGFAGGSFTAIFDAASSWSTGSAAGNIIPASSSLPTTVVAGEAVTFTYDPSTTLWYANV